MSGSGTTLVVVNYGSTALLQNNLVRLAGDLPDVGVVVVDNRTTDVNAVVAYLSQIGSEEASAPVPPPPPSSDAA